VNHFLFYCLGEVEASIIHFSNPPAGSEPLKFASTYAQGSQAQFFYLPLETKSCILEKSTIQWCEAIFYCISCISIRLGILGYWFRKVNSRPYSVIFFCRFHMDMRCCDPLSYVFILFVLLLWIPSSTLLVLLITALPYWMKMLSQLELQKIFLANANLSCAKI
jgi:hypothetical protein